MYEKKRIGVFGAGAIGGVVSGLLSRAGHDVTIIDTWYEHIEKINSNGLIVRNQESEYWCKPNAIHINNLQGIKEKFDIGIISVKSYDTEWVTHALKNYVKDEGFFVGFQNGINDFTISEIVGEEKTLGCVITIAAMASEPGYAWRTDSRGNGTAYKVGEMIGGRTERLKDFVAMMQAVGKTEVTENLLRDRWTKLMVNCMDNTLSGLTGWGTSEVRSEPITQDVAIKIAAEVIHVSKSEGYEITDINGISAKEYLDAASGIKIEELKNKMLEAAKLAGSASRPSFGQDVLKKRRTEVDYLTGYISKIGKKNNVETPICDKITAIVNELGVGFDPSPNHLDEIEKMIS
ncbi:MAG: ketopantoate reductase family protein [Chloroflexota bacterium]|nr:ketopantoate reductase family protein [Chloroflexota bacterium]